MLLSIIVIILAVGADQLTKYLASTYLYGDSITVIPHVVDFTYVENRGAAFGMLADNRWVFLILSTVMIIGVGIYLFAGKHTSKLERLALALIVGGGIGNMIDRVASGFVVDFIDVTFVKFYVFNVADSCVCVGCALMVIWVIADSVREAKAKKSAEKNKASAAAQDDAPDSAEAAQGDTSAETVSDNAVPATDSTAEDNTSAPDKSEENDD